MAESIAAGLVFGLLVAGVNTLIFRRAMEKNTGAALTGAVAIRFALDILALAAVYLIRDRLPLRFEPTLVATAVGLSAGIIGLAVLTSKVKKETPSDDTGGE